jgi:hypothetical protein
VLNSTGRLPEAAWRNLRLATMVAALWTAAVPFTDPAAAGPGDQVSAARAAAIHECSILANRYSERDWADHYRACMAEQGQIE